LIARLGASFDTTQYDVLVGRYANALGNLGFPYDVPTVLDVDDLDTDVYTSKIALAKNVLSKLVLKWHRWNIARGLKRVLSGVNHAFVANPSNRSFSGLQDASVLPNILFARTDEALPYEPTQPENKTVMVIGSYDYEPNIEGVDWLVEKVWAGVHDAIPQARLKIYGSNMSEALRARWGRVAGVDAVGFVDSLQGAYQNTALSVCPVLRGAGSNIKIIESAAHGRVCMLTEAAARGYGDDEELCQWLPVSATPSEMTQGIIHLLNAPEERDRMGENLQTVAASKYSRRHFIDIVKSGVNFAVSNREGRDES
jgi:glycosyltransferase involved in cell wall biosynthesis